MAVNHAGKLMIIQKESIVPDVWENLCGINDTTFTITNAVNSEERVQCADRSQVVETLKQYGAQDMKFDGSGLFDSDTLGNWTADQTRLQAKVPLRVFVPGHGYYECDEWLIPTCTWTGGTTGSLQFSAGFEASGTVTFTAV